MNGDDKQPDGTGSWQYKPNSPDPQPADSSAEQIVSTEAAPDSAAGPVAVEQNAVAVPAPEEHPEVSWTAAEFIHHDKSPMWYGVLIICTVILAAAVLLLSHDKVSMFLIIVIGIIFGVTAGRKPRSLQYLLDTNGITVNRAFRPYGDFKSFAITHEPEVTGIIFLPLRRFTLPLSVYVGSSETDQVIAKLTDYLPNDQTRGHDALDRFVQRIHF
jgi:hypothetical protein